MGRQISIWSVVLSNTQRFTTRRLIYPIWEVITFHSLRHDFLSLRNKFGGLKAIILISIFPNAAQIVDQIEKHVLGAKGNEAMVYRKSILDDCAMLSVAAAIIGNASMSALGLQHLHKVNWTARAAFVLSLVTGGLSVFYACLIQQKLRSLFTTEDVKDFFSRPSTSLAMFKFEKSLDKILAGLRAHNADGEANVECLNRIQELEATVKDFKTKNRWKSASFHSILMVKTPTLLLKYSVGFFIVGLGIYFGGLATRDGDVQIPRDCYKLVFAAYFVGTLLALFIYYLPATLKDLELAPSRRYAWLVIHALWKDTSEPPPKEILEQLNEIFNASCFNEQESCSIRVRDDALSWKERLGHIKRPQTCALSDTTADRKVDSRDNSFSASVNHQNS